MKVFIAADHAGYEMKAKLIHYLRALGYDVDDKGAYEYNEDDDFPDFIAGVAKEVMLHPNDVRGVVIGGSGQGEAMAANRYRGVRAAVYYGAATSILDDSQSILTLSRAHNDANVLSIGARFITDEEAQSVVKKWLETPFSQDERHARRISKMDRVRESTSLNTRVTILGRGPLAEPLAHLAERAGHTMRWVQEAPPPWREVERPDLVILVGSNAAVRTLLGRVAPSIADCTVVVDATIPTVNDRDGGEADLRGTEWISALMKGARIVRAFASVPADAVATVLHERTSETETPPRLAVPLAADDQNAKALVMKFMREIGVDPFDLGALANADVIAPGGALWGKALNSLEMLEAVGLLSGGG